MKRSKKKILMIIDYTKINFIKSVPNIKYFFKKNIIEIAIIGYSNTGKSSVINTLSNKKISNTSKIPGKTKMINLFTITKNFQILDFPGYGYAKIYNKKRKNWIFNILQYIKKGKNLKAIILVLDIRFLIKSIDKTIITLAIQNKKPILILLNKADKLSVNMQKKQFIKLKKFLLIFSKNITIDIFSSLKKTNVHILKRKINFWYTN